MGGAPRYVILLRPVTLHLELRASQKHALTDENVCHDCLSASTPCMQLHASISDVVASCVHFMSGDLSISHVCFSMVCAYCVIWRTCLVQGILDMFMRTLLDVCVCL